MQVNKSLQGVTFNDFSVHNVQWKEGSTAEFVDIMNWADHEAHTTETDSTTASPIGEPLGGNDPADQVVINPKDHELPPQTDDLQGQIEESPDDIPILERLCRVAANGQTVDEKGIKQDLKRLCPLNSDKVTPIPKSVARQLFADEKESQPKVIPSERIE